MFGVSFALQGCGAWDYSLYFARMADEATVDFGNFNEEYAAAHPAPPASPNYRPGDALPDLPGYTKISEHNASATPFLSRIRTRVWVRNLGEKDATQLQWSWDTDVGSQNFSVRDNCNGTIKPYRLGGKPCAIDVTFYPSTALGDIPGRLVLTYRGGSDKPLVAKLAMRGNSQAIPFLYLDETPAFPTVYVPGMTESTQRFRVRFNGARLPEPYRSSFPSAENVTFSVVGDQAVRFAVLGAPTTTCGASVNNDCEVAVRFLPGASVGAAGTEYRPSLRWTFDTAAGGGGSTSELYALATPIIPATLASTAPVFSGVQRNPKVDLAPVRLFTISRATGNLAGVIHRVVAPAANFEIVSEDCTGRSFAAGASSVCVVNVRFRPGITGDALPNTRTANFQVVYESGDIGPQTLTVPLSAQALAPGRLDVTYPSGSELSFGPVCAYKATGAQAATLQNTGGGAVTAVSVPTVPGGSHFTWSHACPASVAAGGSCNANVIFRGLAAGNLNANFRVSYDTGTQDLGIAQAQVNLKGESLSGSSPSHGCLELVSVGAASPAVVNACSANRFMWGGVQHVFPVNYHLYGTTPLSGGANFAGSISPAEFVPVSGSTCVGMAPDTDCTVQLRYTTPAVPGGATDAGVDVTLSARASHSPAAGHTVSIPGKLHLPPALVLTAPAELRGNTDWVHNLNFSLRNTSGYFRVIPDPAFLVENNMTVSGGAAAVMPTGTLSGAVLAGCAAGLAPSAACAPASCTVPLPFTPATTNVTQSFQLKVRGLGDLFGRVDLNAEVNYSPVSSRLVTLTSAPTSLDLGLTYFEANRAADTPIVGVASGANKFTLRYLYGRDPTSITGLSAVGPLTPTYSAACPSGVSTPGPLCDINVNWRPTVEFPQVAGVNAEIGRARVTFSNPFALTPSPYEVAVRGAYVKKIPQVTLAAAPAAASVNLGTTQVIRLTATNGTGLPVGKVGRVTSLTTVLSGTADWTVNLSPSVSAGERACGAVSVASESSMLALGASCVFEVSVTPRALGAATGRITFSVYNSANEFAGTVTRDLAVTGYLPTLALVSTFATSAQGGAGVSRVLRMTNNGLNNASLLAYSVTGLTPASSSASLGAGCASVASGATCDIPLSVSATVVGTTSGTVRMTWNASAQVRDLPWSVNFTPLTPSALASFAAPVGGTSSPQTLTLTNPAAEGTAPALTFPALSSGVFRYAAGGQPGASGRCAAGVALAPGTSCTLLLEFRPTDPGAASLVYSIGRTGLAALDITLNGAGDFPASLAAVSGGAAFGAVNLGSAQTRTLTLQSAVGATGLSFAAPSAPYRFSNPGGAGACANIAAGGSCSLTLEYLPTSQVSSTYNFTMTVGSATSAATSFSGNGVLPTAAGTTFPSVPTGSSRTANVAISNVGAGGASTLTYEFSSSATGFSYDGAACSTVAAGGTCALPVTYTATGVGSVTGQIRVRRGSEFGPWVPLNVVATQPMKVFAGPANTCIFDEQDRLRCWGSNEYGQLANGSAGGSATPGASVVINLGGHFTDIRKVAISNTHICALGDSGATTGLVTCWGTTESGVNRLGLNPWVANRYSVAGVQYVQSGGVNVTGVRDIAAGYGHTCAVTTNQMYCWGQNNFGKLGLSSTGSTTAVVATALPAGRTGAGVAAGRSHSCVFFMDGGARCFGANGVGQSAATISAGEVYADSIYWAALTGDLQLGGIAVGALALGHDSSHSCALSTAGAVKCFGQATETPFPTSSTSFAGLLGYCRKRTGAPAAVDCSDTGTISGDERFAQAYGNTAEMAALPSVNLGSGFTAAQLGVGGKHVCVRSAAGVVKCWGKNNLAQLGTSVSQAGQTTASMGNGLGATVTGATDLAVSENGGCAVTAGGYEVWCWGGGAGALPARTYAAP